MYSIQEQNLKCRVGDEHKYIVIHYKSVMYIYCFLLFDVKYIQDG
jgi:hypothetical protein